MLMNSIHLEVSDSAAEHVHLSTENYLSVIVLIFSHNNFNNYIILLI